MPPGQHTLPPPLGYILPPKTQSATPPVSIYHSHFGYASLLVSTPCLLLLLFSFSSFCSSSSFSFASFPLPPLLPLQYFFLGNGAGSLSVCSKLQSWQYKAWHWWGYHVTLAAYGVGDRTAGSPICGLNANLVGDACKNSGYWG